MFTQTMLKKVQDLMNTDYQGDKNLEHIEAYLAYRESRGEEKSNWIQGCDEIY